MEHASREQTKGAELASIEQLFGDAWQLFKKTLLQYVKFLLVSLLIIICVGGIGFTAFGFVSLGVLRGHHLVGGAFTILLFMLLGIALFVFLIIFLSAISISLVFIISGKGGKFPIKETLKKALPLVVPYLAATILTGLLVYAGFFTFVIPGFIFVTLFFFQQYAVIIEKKRPLDAIKSSYSLVASRFWPVFLRLIVILALDVIIQTFFTRVFKELMWLYVLASPFISWYVAAYTYTLYKELRAMTLDKKPDNFGWVWVIGVIGWIIIVGLVTLMIVFGIRGMRHRQQLYHPRQQYYAPRTATHFGNQLSPISGQPSGSPSPTLYVNPK